MVLRSLDLFSGVAGITRALEGFAKPVMYCEIDTGCHTVLEKLMKQGKIPRAPVDKDVAKLDGKKLRGKIDIIAAGVPCVGFSSAGKREAFENDQSGLYRHVLRLVDEAQPSYVFIENVMGIVNLGVKHITATLTKRGYILWWLVIPAWAVGAPQKRSRWFCLAVKRSKLGSKLTNPPWTPHDWRKEPVPRMVVAKTTREDASRMGMLGNGVVPDCVRMAFMLLWTGLRVPAPEVRKLKTLTLTLPETRPVKGKADMHFAGAMEDGKILAVPAPQGLLDRPSGRYVLDPAAYKSPVPSMHELTSGIVKTPHTMNIWATPRHGNGLTASRVLTRRGLRDLGTQLRFARCTPAALRKGHTNPRWTEWLMGYPQDWTAHK